MSHNPLYNPQCITPHHLGKFYWIDLDSNGNDLRSTHNMGRARTWGANGLTHLGFCRVEFIFFWVQYLIRSFDPTIFDWYTTYFHHQMG